MAEFLDIPHAEFSYLFVPAAIEDPVQVRRFAGTEGAFQALLKAHFAQTTLNEAQKNDLETSLAKEAKAGAEAVFDLKAITETVQGNYQIIPLTVPTASNGHTCVNVYIDNVGRVKGEATNARASRITSDDIKGDCFIVKSFDDEDNFSRLSLGMADFDELLASPPEKSGRWDPQNALLNLQGKGESVMKAAAKPSEPDCCSNCFLDRKAIEAKGKLLRCGRCRKAAYCSAECQRKDWAFHKRICAAPRL